MSERPVLRVVSGDATPEEIAAVVAAVAASAAPGAPPEPAPTTSVWAGRGWGHRCVRAASAPGPESWRTSFWPR